MFYLMWKGQTHFYTYDLYRHETSPVDYSQYKYFLCHKYSELFCVNIQIRQERKCFLSTIDWTTTHHNHTPLPRHHNHTSLPLYHDHTSLPLHHSDTSLCPGEGCQQTPQETEPPQSSRSWCCLSVHFEALWCSAVHRHFEHLTGDAPRASLPKKTKDHRT